MPKIIDNLQGKISDEVKRQIKETGYSKMTIRSVAGALGIGTGTVYNYFKSKEEMVASIMAIQWVDIFSKMKKDCENEKDPRKVISVIYNGIAAYSANNSVLFIDPEAIESFGKLYFEKHTVLKKQLASLLEDSCRAAAVRYTDYLSEFIAESILSFYRDRKDIAELIKTIDPLFKQEG